MKKRLSALALLAATGLVIYSAGGDGAPGAERVGYFKSQRNDRVIAYAAPAPLNDAEARKVLARAPATAGAATMAVIYHPGALAPGDKLTAAPNLAAAARLIGEAPFDGWSHRLRINPAGVSTYD
ncbi:hypothetical protein [Roseobacter litoralis]|uniref:hypothetical protein n=1 Tax=Roseobacter litoralis TaxID=42443 RepID=UPI0024958760|nr:hypothetical protein [Roseobacter litoralis]